MLGRPVAVGAHTTAALVTLPGRVIGLMTLAEQTLSAMRTTVTRTDALLDRVEALTARGSAPGCLLDRLPQLADAMDHEVIPLLAHLD